MSDRDRTSSADTGEGVNQLLSAAWVAPMSGPIIRDGAVVIRDNRIVDVGTTAALRQAFPNATEIDHGNAVLLPGLINAHAHLDLTRVPRPPAPSSFVGWIKGIIAASMDRTDWRWWLESAMEGCRQSLAFGMTTVGDISSRFTKQVREGLEHRDDLRITSYGEVTAMAQRRSLLKDRLAIAVDNTSKLRVGISPHAPYSIEPEGYSQCFNDAFVSGIPLATHLAETPYEAEFLASHSGPFRELWEFLGAWDDQVPTFQGGPIRYAEHLGLLDYAGTLLAHVNYCDDDELAILAKGKASVAYCPRTHQYFGHPPHRFRDMLAAGINVVVGTDSCASSADLNLVDDLRLAHQIAPELPVETIWAMATTGAAQSIGASDVGTLERFSYADIVAFPIQTNDPLREILEAGVKPSAVWCNGRRLQSEI